jgi:hypothetical protein
LGVKQTSNSGRGRSAFSQDRTYVAAIFQLIFSQNDLNQGDGQKVSVRGMLPFLQD